MKKTDPVQLAVLVVALLLGYNALQTVPYFLWLLYNWVSEGLTLAGSFYNVGINFLYLAFYTTVTLFLIKKSKNIAQKIAHTASFSQDITITLNKNDILYVTLAAMGSYILATKLPKLLITIYAHIRESNHPLSYQAPDYILQGENIPEYIIIIILATIMLMYAKTITRYLTRNMPEDTDIDAIGDIFEENK